MVMPSFANMLMLLNSLIPSSVSSPITEAPEALKFADPAPPPPKRLPPPALARASDRLDRAGDKIRSALGLQQHLAAARAVGRDAASRLYRQILSRDAANLPARAAHRAVRFRDARIAHEGPVHADAARIGK